MDTRRSARSLIQFSLLLIALVAVGCGKSDSSTATTGGPAVPNTGGTAVPNTGGSVSGGSAEPGYTPLFDGRHLTGWVFGKDDLDGQDATPDYRFQTKDGVIRMSARGQDGKTATKEIVSTRKFAKDFVLKLEFRAAQEATGAVIVRGHGVPVADFERRNEQNLKHFKTDGWNELEVTVRQITRADNRALRDGDHLQASYVNGKAVAKLNGHDIDPNVIWVRTEGFARCNNETLSTPGSFVVPSSGTVAIQARSGKLEFRNIRFKELD
jgi:hypothetical protein